MELNNGFGRRRARARRLVEMIAEEHGYLSEEVYARMDQETRRVVEEAFRIKDEMIGSSITTYVLLNPY